MAGSVSVRSVCFSATLTWRFAPTASASRYLQQLAKHWAHKLDVTFDTERATIGFPNGAVAALGAGETTLAIRLTVAGDDAGRMRKVIEEHLDRFAFREAPLAYDWRAETAVR